MFQKTHFHQRGVAKMKNRHFDAGFIGTKIRALAQRGAQNSCPGAFRSYFLDVFCLRDPEGVNLDPNGSARARLPIKHG